MRLRQNDNNARKHGKLYQFTPRRTLPIYIYMISNWRIVLPLVEFLCAFHESMVTATHANASPFCLYVFFFSFCVYRSNLLQIAFRVFFFFLHTLRRALIAHNTHSYILSIRAMPCDFYQWKCRRGLSTTELSKPEPIKKRIPDIGNECAHGADESYSTNVDDSVRKARKKMGNCQRIYLIWSAVMVSERVPYARICRCSYSVVVNLQESYFRRWHFASAYIRTVACGTIQANPFCEPSIRKSNPNQVAPLFCHSHLEWGIFVWKESRHWGLTGSTLLLTMSAMCNSELINSFEMNVNELRNECAEILRYFKYCKSKWNKSVRSNCSNSRWDKFARL